MVDPKSFLSNQFHLTADSDDSALFLDSLIDNLPNMVFVKRADDLTFVRFNRAGLELVGIKKEEILGKSDFDLFPKDQALEFVRRDREVLAGNRVVDIPEEYLHTKTSGIRILHTKKIPWHGAGGEVRYLLGISEDITDQKQLEADARKKFLVDTEERARIASLERLTLLSELSVLLNESLNYHAAFESISNRLVSGFCEWSTIIIRKQSDEYERVVSKHNNPSLLPFLESMKSVGPSQGVRDLIHTGATLFLPVVKPETFCKEAKAEGYEAVVEKLEVKSYLAVAIRGRSQIHGSLSVFRGENEKPFTIEDRLFAEELGRRAGLAFENALLYDSAKEALAARDQFLSVASHELKTPVTSMKMNLQLALRKPAEAKRLIERADKQIDRLVKLIENLLDVSRIRLGKLGIQCEHVNLSELMLAVIGDHAEALKNAGCEFTYKIEDNVSAFVDRSRVEQIVINLLSNAAKYAADAPVHLELRADDLGISLEIRDHGPGIPELQQEKLFERFSRGKASRNISGLGLGLFICREIAQSHGGTLMIRKPEGEGSIFELRLPRT